MLSRFSRPVLLVAAAALAACGGKSGSPTQPTPVSAQPAPAPQPPPTPVSGGAFDGAWAGSPFVGGQITFKVANSTITVITLSGVGCSKSYNVTANAPISDDAFNYSTTSNPNPDVALTISGRFSSQTHVSGTMSFGYKSDCSGSAFSVWSASRQ